MSGGGLGSKSRLRSLRNQSRMPDTKKSALADYLDHQLKFNNWCAHWDSNPEPDHYEWYALTIELQARYSEKLFG